MRLDARTIARAVSTLVLGIYLVGVVAIIVLITFPPRSWVVESIWGPYKLESPN
jgi:hypothetical protein